MLRGALELAIISRLASKSFNITGVETLGISQVHDPTSPYNGRIPIPPFLDFQIDSLWFEKMGKIKKRVLSELKKRFMNRKPDDWYMIYLTVVVLLSNLEFIYEHQQRQQERYCETVKLPLEKPEDRGLC